MRKAISRVGRPLRDRHVGWELSAVVSPDVGRYGGFFPSRKGRRCGHVFPFDLNQTQEEIEKHGTDENHDATQATTTVLQRRQAACFNEDGWKAYTWQPPCMASKHTLPALSFQHRGPRRPRLGVGQTKADRKDVYELLAQYGRRPRGGRQSPTTWFIAWAYRRINCRITVPRRDAAVAAYVVLRRRGTKSALGKSVGPAALRREATSTDPELAQSRGATSEQTRPSPHLVTAPSPQQHNNTTTCSRHPPARRGRPRFLIYHLAFLFCTAAPAVSATEEAPCYSRWAVRDHLPASICGYATLTDWTASAPISRHSGYITIPKTWPIKKPELTSLHH